MKRKKSEPLKEQAPVRDKLAELLEIPEENIRRDSSVYVIGRRKAEITGCRCVLEYSHERIILQTGKGSVTMHGTRLEICSLLKDQITVRGEISALNFSTKEGVG